MHGNHVAVLGLERLDARLQRLRLRRGAASRGLQVVQCRLCLLPCIFCKRVSMNWRRVSFASHTFLDKLLLQFLGLLLRLLCRGLQDPRALLAALDSCFELDIGANLVRLQVIVGACLGFDLGEQRLD